MFTLEFVVEVMSTVDLLTIVITGVIPVIDVEMFAENGLTVMVTALDLSLSSP